MAKEMEKLAVIRKEEIDNQIDLPRKNKIYKEQKIIYEKHKTGEISTERYFQSMRLLMLKDFEASNKMFNSYSNKSLSNI